MRPLEKWTPGLHNIPDESTIEISTEYNPYQGAKPHLVENLGCICSYCEKAYTEPRDLAVEHIQPKGYKDTSGTLVYDHLKYRWSNFLLACSTCNGTDNKGDNDVVPGSIHLPHLNNTFLSLRYDTGGVVSINPDLPHASKTHAQSLLDLIGLNKGPAESKPGDTRWRSRLEKWNQAEHYLEKYQNGEVQLECILDIIKASGFWSIWFTVFKGQDDVRKAMIESFPGTAADCFDPNNHYEPIYRNPSNSEDPV